MNSIKEIFFNLKDQLSNIYDPGEAAAITELVAYDVLGLGRIGIIMNYDALPSEDQLDKWMVYQKELLSCRPIQYVIGKTVFYGMELKIDESVLIPRPETEELVDLCLDKLQSNTTAKILDIGTGSGCIALALKNSLPEANVFGLDCSEAALELAEYNARIHQLDVQFVKCNVLKEELGIDLSQLDVIISNPPYITTDEMETLASNVVDFEPHHALFVTNKDPLQFYKRIEEIAQNSLKPDGMIFLEMHERFAKNVKDYFIGKGWKCSLYQDFQGKERMLMVKQ